MCKEIQERKAAHGQQGFTLVELSIVLVIIGLIVGGVLVGQDMIKAAELRSTISQIEKYNTAVNTFRDKYRYIPGDINQTHAVNVGLYNRTANVNAGNGDGNGILESCGANPTTAGSGLLGGCETLLFWRDLSDAKMVEGTYQALVTSGSGGTAIAIAAVPNFFPEAKLGRGNRFTVMSAGGVNYYEISAVSAVSNAGAYTLAPAMSPFEAFNIDSKVDDSLPLTGVVRGAYSLTALNAVPATNANIPAGPTTGTAGNTISDCINGDANIATTSDPYHTANEVHAAFPACQLRFRFN
jgi:prepilin-type N-terminal cleavage/methylation domain-containing protein